MKKIDAHIHFSAGHADGLALLKDVNVHLLNICVAHDEAGAWRSQAQTYQNLATQYPDRFAWCTSFDLPRFDDPDYVEKVIAGLAQDFQAGAIACKIWKNIGMEVKKPDGAFIMLDDSLFDPIYEFLTKENKTLLLHIGEPLACWRPLIDDNPHYNYYRNNPEWHMYNKPEYPSHSQLMIARDHMVAKHPQLRVVGAHLASLEYDVAEVAKRLDKYPNLAVDTSARTADLTYQDPGTVRQFFEDYQDRILFGTDIVQRQSLGEMTEDKRVAWLAWAKDRYLTEFAYYESSEEVVFRERKTQGLGLSESVLEKFYVSNAQIWYPGLDVHPLD